MTSQAPTLAQTLADASHPFAGQISKLANVLQNQRVLLTLGYLERALQQQRQISLVVTKASGTAGGEATKRQLAQN